MNDETWYVYIIRCSDNSLYTGAAKNVQKRFKKHNAGTGAKYTKFRRPLELVYQNKIGSRSDALKEEYRIKSLSKSEKEKLIDDHKDNTPS